MMPEHIVYIPMRCPHALVASGTLNEFLKRDDSAAVLY